MNVVPRNADEVRDLLQSLRDRLDDVDRWRHALSAWKEATNGRIDDLERENDQLQERLDVLEARLDVLEDGTTSKEGKIRNLVEKAENLRTDSQDGVVLTARDIVGATGVSRRYAYDLIDDLPNEYHWVLSREEARQHQYGTLEIDGTKQTKAIVVDCERLHSDPEAVNKFTTTRRREED